MRNVRISERDGEFGSQLALLPHPSQPHPFFLILADRSIHPDQYQWDRS